MSVRNGLFSSESVSEGHPDKLADRISDAVLDEFLRLEPSTRVACETLLADQCVVVAGEFKTRDPDVFRQGRERAVPIVAGVLRDAGYRDCATGIDPERCEVQVRFNGQSADINRGVDRADAVIGAGDQGLMFGYLPESGTAQGAALAFFRRMAVDDLETLGVDVVEGEHPGSTYYAAELRGDIDEANRAAEAAGIPVRFVAARD